MKKKIKVRIVEVGAVEIPIRERKGRICDECQKEKPTDKVGEDYLCKDCREDLSEEK